MSTAVPAVVLAALAFACLGPVSTRLAQAEWPSLAPRAAVVVWQVLGIVGGLSIIGAGAAVGVSRFDAGLLGGASELFGKVVDGHPLAGMGMADALGLTLACDIAVVMACTAAVTTWRTVQARARHRRLVDLVSTDTERAPGVALLDHPRAAAYCVPGLRPRIVVSAGTLRLLDRQQLAAVLEHERGHAHEHHGLVMLPFTSFGALLRWIPYARVAPRAVAVLLEMAADDYAARQHDPVDLASALVEMTGAATPPACAFAAATGDVAARVARLLGPRRTSPAVALAAVVGSALLVAVPVALALAA